MEASFVSTISYDVPCRLTVSGHPSESNRGTDWGVFRKSIARLSTISSQFYRRKKGGEERGAFRGLIARAICTKRHSPFPGAWNDRHGAIRGAERIVLTGRQKRYPRHGAIGSGAVVALLPIIRGLLARGRKRQSLRNVLLGRVLLERRERENLRQVDVKLDGESIVIKLQWRCVVDYSIIFKVSAVASWISYVSLHSIHLFVRGDYFLKKTRKIWKFSGISFVPGKIS